MLHHGHPVGDLGDDAEIVGDEQHARPAPLLQILDQRQDLRLRGDVEGGGRLVGDQESRVEHHRGRDHDALPLAARELVRIDLEKALRLRQAHGRHDLDHPSRRSAAPSPVWMRSISSIWSPTVRTGLRAVIGSWKIMAMRVPRS